MWFKRFSVFATALLFLVSLFTGCSDDSDPTGPEENQSNPPQMSITEAPVTIPTKMQQAAQTSPTVAMAVGFMNQANSLPTYSAMFTPPQNSSLAKAMGSLDSDPWIYTFKDSTIEITMKIYETDEANVFEYFLSGSDGINTYDNWRLLYGEDKKDGSGGSLEFYVLGQTEPSLKWIWDFSTSGVEKLTLLITDPRDVMKIEITTNTDGSGEFTLSEREADGSTYIVSEKVTWNADGSGQWWEYYEGEIVDSGTWS